MSRPANLVVVPPNSLNRHLLGTYGGSEFEAPNLDAVASERDAAEPSITEWEGR